MNPPGLPLKTNIIRVWIDEKDLSPNKPHLCFSGGHSDAWSYEFNDEKPLYQASRVQYVPFGVDKTTFPTMNKDLAQVGDIAMKDICRVQAFSNGDDQATWKSRCDYGVGMNSYLSDRASRNGVWDNIMMIDGVRAPSFAEIPPRKAEADTMEALIGAVHVDSGCNKEVVKEVATCLGVYYPEKGIDAEKFDRWIAFLQGSGIVGTTKR